MKTKHLNRDAIRKSHRGYHKLSKQSLQERRALIESWFLKNEGEAEAPGLPRSQRRDSLFSSGTLRFNQDFNQKIRRSRREPIMDNMIIRDQSAHGVHIHIPEDEDPISEVGKFQPLLRGFIVIGPEYSKIIWTFIFYGALSSFLFVTMNWIDQAIGQGAWTPFPILLALVIISYIKVVTTEPGVVPKTFDFQSFLRCMKDCNWKEYKINKLMQGKYCSICQAVRPLRSYHCMRCGICIYRQDMHFVMGGTCVGHLNARYFYFLTIVNTLLGLYVTFLYGFAVFYGIYKTGCSEEVKDLYFDMGIASFILGICTLFFPQIGLPLFFFRFYLLKKNTTFREDFRFNNFGYLKGENSRRNFFFNLIDFCSTSRWRSLIWCKDLYRIEYQSQPNEDSFNITSDLNGNISINQEDIENDNQSVYTANPSNKDQNSNSLSNVHFKASVQKMSLPNLEQGELPMRPGTRLRIKKQHKTPSVIKQKVEEFRVLQRDPPTIQNSINVQHERVISNLSEGCIPRDPGSQQDITYLARARQYQQVIRFLLLRDRDGLINYSTRIDLPALIGIPDVDPDNLQLIELSNGVPLIMGRGYAAPRRPRGHIGIPQMVAAGMIPVGQVRQNHQEREHRRVLRFFEDLRIIESSDRNLSSNSTVDGLQRRNQIQSLRNAIRTLPDISEEDPPASSNRRSRSHHYRRRNARRRQRAVDRIRNRNPNIDIYNIRDVDIEDNPESSSTDEDQ